MSRSMFGWSLPPGVTSRMIDEAYGREEPCQICGLWPDDCICPECPVCGSFGDPACYDGCVKCSYCGTRPAGFVCTPDTCSTRYSCDHFKIETSREEVPSHGLVRSLGQVCLRAAAEEQWRLETQQEHEFYEQLARDYHEEVDR